MRHVLVPVAFVVAFSSVVSAQATREATYNERAVIQVNAKLRFTTMIILPEHEVILDFICGDKDFWIVSGNENLAYVKPAKARAQTNLNLVTASGHVYSFLLAEGEAEPDLKLYVMPDERIASGSTSRPKYYAASEVEALRKELEDARKGADAARTAAASSIEDGINAFRASYPTGLQFPYRFKAHERPFNVSAIFHDGRFTYIRASASELPSLYEVRDGAPNLVNFQVENGMYVVPKVLERGYLAVGAQKWTFESRR